MLLACKRLNAATAGRLASLRAAWQRKPPDVYFVGLAPINAGNCLQKGQKKGWEHW